MPSTQGIRAGRAFVELFADDSKLVRGLRRAEKKLKFFGDSIRNVGLKTAGLGAAVLAPLLGAAKVFSSMGDQVAKMAKRTGFGVEALSQLRFVASQTGTSLEAMETGFRRMQRSIYDAGRGLSTQTDALADLGLTFKDLDGLAPEDQFKLLAESISRIEDPTRKAALAQALFGRAGTQLLPMMAQGAAGIKRLREEARRLGLTMSREDAAAAEDFTDAMDRLWKTVKMGAFRIGAALSPALGDLAGRLTRAAVTTGAWISKNRQLIVTVTKVAAAVLAAGLALAALGKAISIVGALAGALRALHLATSFLIANPIALAFVGVAAAVAVALVAIRQLTHHTAELTDFAAKYREEQDKARASDMERMARLRELAGAEQLSNTQMDEAARLIRTLEDRYGDLGVSLDRAAGKVRGFTDAQKRLNEAMRASAIAEVEAELAERQRNVRELQAEIDSTWTQLWNWATDSIGALMEKRGIEYRYREGLMRRLEALRGGSDEALTAGPEGGDGAVVPGGAQPAEGLDAAAATDLARRLHQLRLSRIEDEEQRALALMNERYNAEQTALEKKGATTAQLWKLDQARELELAAIRQRFADERAEEDRRQADEQAEAEQARAEALARRTRALDQEIARARINATMEGADRDLALLELERQAALEEARELGTDASRVNELFDLRAQALRVPDLVGEQATKLGARGTFSAFVERAFGGRSTAERAAKAAEKTAENTDQMRRRLERGLRVDMTFVS
jgi:hypothetical protein